MWPKYSSREIRAVKSTLQSGKVNYWTGEECRLFEREFASFTNSKYAIALANGTLALDLALYALNIGDGDEVIVTSRTFIASVSSIINIGAKPIFCDVDKNSQNLDVEKITYLITKNTKAILCVHLAGWPCDMDEVKKIAQQYNLYIIEDCAQAHGAKYKGKSVGSLGDIGCWSFCQDKIMSTGGEGGMVTTNKKALWKKMWSFKDHGKSFDAVYNKTHPPGFKWLHYSFGSNYRMIEIQAVIGRIQLELLKSWTLRRNNYQNKIWNAAKNIPGLIAPSFKCLSCNCNDKAQSCVHAAYKCYVFVKPQSLSKNWSRDRIISEINSQGVICLSGSCSEVYLEKAFNKTKLRPKTRLPVAKQLGETSLMFLIDPSQSNQDIEKICNTLRIIMKKATS